MSILLRTKCSTFKKYNLNTSNNLVPLVQIITLRSELKYMRLSCPHAFAYFIINFGQNVINLKYSGEGGEALQNTFTQIH